MGSPSPFRHLLYHTSGLRDYLTLMSLAGISFDGFNTDDNALDIIARQRELNFAPGEEHLYSNSDYFLLSQIVERAAGQSLREYAGARIFKPLGMEGTHFHDDHIMVVPCRARRSAKILTCFPSAASSSNARAFRPSSLSPSSTPAAPFGCCGASTENAAEYVRLELRPP